MQRTAIIERVSHNFKGVIDVTLREGEQCRGLEFTLAQAKKILHFAKLVGIQRSEIPNPVNPRIRDYLQKLIAFSERPGLYPHIRARESDFDAALEVSGGVIGHEGISGVHILATARHERLADMGLTLGDYLKQLEILISRAHSYGLEVRVGVEHAWDVATEDMLAIYELCDGLQVARVNIADTRGSATHYEVAETVGLVVSRLKHAWVQVHFHNDCGSSVSNALEAFVHGASYIDTTFLGIGERMGITPISLLFARLANLDLQLLEGFHPEYLYEAETYVASLVDTEVTHMLPTSTYAATHKAGIHLREIARRGAQSYEANPPELFGNHRDFETESRISGSTTIAQLASIQ